MFQGKYYKHQKDGNTVCIIEGKADSGAFLQVVTNQKVYHYRDFAGCRFAPDGVTLDLPDIKGEVRYAHLTPLKRDIMGIFRFFPLQCRHHVYSMHHGLTGQFTVEGQSLDFNGGTGYTEGDSGRSFPRQYFWVHGSDFPEKCSVMASVAHIPFGCFHFRGCICAVVFQNREYILATYKGVRIDECSRKRLSLTQGDLRLDITLSGGTFLPLVMPVKSRMSATVSESANTVGRFIFYEKNKCLFDYTSGNVTFEHHDPAAKED